MTADEIRNKYHSKGAYGLGNFDAATQVQAEIAAQLAEMNERLKLATLTAYVPDSRDEEPWNDSKTTAEMHNSIAGR